MLEERSVFGVHGVDPGLELQELDHANVLVHGFTQRVGCCGDSGGRTDKGCDVMGLGWDFALTSFLQSCQIELVAGGDWGGGFLFCVCFVFQRNKTKKVYVTSACRTSTLDTSKRARTSASAHTSVSDRIET